MNLQRFGAIVVLLIALIWISQSEAKKKKRVIVKVPARIKHIYHHHTKNLHIHKPRPKPDSYKSSSYKAPRPRPPPPKHGKKRYRYRDETYDEDYGLDEYDYGGGYSSWSDKGNRGRYADDYRGYDYEPPAPKTKWSKRVKPAYVKKPPSYKLRKVPKKPYRDLYESSSTDLWPDVKEHDSWHQARPQGFQQNSPVIPTDQYHDTSIHGVDYADKQPSEFVPAVVAVDGPTYERPAPFHAEQQYSDQFYDRASVEFHQSPLIDYSQAQGFVPVTSEPAPYQQSFDNAETYDAPFEPVQPHHVQ